MLYIVVFLVGILAGVLLDCLLWSYYIWREYDPREGRE